MEIIPKAFATANIDMADQPTTSFPAPSAESQHARWLKYGSNVALSLVVVIALAAGLTYLAQTRAARIDTTLGGSQSLSPQTVTLLKDLNHKVRIVALYPRLKREAGQQDEYQAVVDLLDNYASKGNGNVTAEVIDPDADKDKVNKLIAELTNKYGGEISAYRAFVDGITKSSDPIDKSAQAELEKVDKLPLDKITDEQIYFAAALMRQTLATVHNQFTRLQKELDAEQDQPVPSYKEEVDLIHTRYSNVSRELQLVAQVLAGLAKSDGVPAEVKDFGPGSAERVLVIGKQADAVLDSIDKLPKLKEENEFRDQLKSKSLIVLTDTDYRVIPETAVWTKPPRDVLSGETVANRQVQRIFSGEQQISLKIMAMTSPKRPLVVFVRPGGAPLTMDMTGRGALFGQAAQWVSDYNFEVQEKSFGQQPPQQEMPPMPEPSAEDLKKAIWVVAGFPDEMGTGMEMTTALVDHIKSGDSAMLLLMTGSKLDAATQLMGVDVKQDYVLVHEPYPSDMKTGADQLLAYEKQFQFFIRINQYGNHPVVKALNGLDSILALANPVSATATVPADVTVTPIMPAPSAPHCWASKLSLPELQQYLSSGDTIPFKTKTDLDSTAPSPVYAGAVAENKATGARLVVVGLEAFSDQFAGLRDTDGETSKLPGSSALFVNSILWLSKDAGMLELGPRALQVGRIKPLSNASLAFWRLGVLSIGLPLLVVIAGIFVYVRRAD